jgi:hypothetical protein
VLFVEGFLHGRLGGSAPDDVELEIVAGRGAVRRATAPGDVREPEITLVVDRQVASLSVGAGTAEVE